MGNKRGCSHSGFERSLLNKAANLWDDYEVKLDEILSAHLGEYERQRDENTATK